MLEVACNDGSFLDALADRGLETVGVDPATNQIPPSNGSKTFICGYFPDVDLPDSHYDLVVGQNVLAHTPDPLKFLAGVREVLSDDGVAIIQTSQAEMLRNGEFDTVYHEHYSYFTPSSISQIALRAGLRVEAVNFTRIHGTSMLVTLRHLEAPDSDFRVSPTLSSGAFALSESDSKSILDFSSAGGWDGIFASFATRSENTMHSVRELVEDAREKGRNVVLVGAAAKAVTFAVSAQLEVDGVLDEAPDKIGRRIPALGQVILPLTQLNQFGDDPLLIISAWNFRDELERKCRIVKPQGGSFLVYFPELVEWK